MVWVNRAGVLTGELDARQDVIRKDAPIHPNSFVFSAENETHSIVKDFSAEELLTLLYDVVNQIRANSTSVEVLHGNH